MWRVKIFVPVTTTESTAIKKLAEAVEVAIAKRTLGVNVGLLPRKRIGLSNNTTVLCCGPCKANKAYKY